MLQASILHKETQVSPSPGPPPVSLSFLSRHTPLQQVPNLFSTQAGKAKITHTENPGWLRCCSTDEREGGGTVATARFRCPMNRLYSSDVFKRRQTENEALDCSNSHVLKVKWLLCFSHHHLFVISDVPSYQCAVCTACILTLPLSF